MGGAVLKPNDFAGATGYLRAMEKRILTTAGFERVMDAPTCEEALKMLSQSSELDFSSIDKTDDYEEVLNTELQRVYKMMYELSPYNELVDIMTSKYDFHNIKVALKSHYLNENYERLFINVTNLNPKEIQNAVASGDDKNIPVFISEAINEAKANYEEFKDPQLLDIILDKCLFSHISKLSESIESDFIKEYVRFQADFFNLKTLLRVKQMNKDVRFYEKVYVRGIGSVDGDLFLDSYDKPIESLLDSFRFQFFGSILQTVMEKYEKTGTFSDIERLIDNFVMQAAKESQLVSFGPEPVFAYMIAKENEIKQMRMLITCKANNIPMEILRERMRENYA